MLILRFTLNENQCPYCQRTHALERINRPFWVKAVLFFLNTRAYICTGCRKRFNHVLR